MDLGRNVKAEVEGDTLILRLDLKAVGERSASGKTLVVATTSGNVPVPGTNPVMSLGLNLYHK
jgi:hypothetical protein